jgi:hypothetical protein
VPHAYREEEEEEEEEEEDLLDPREEGAIVARGPRSTSRCSMMLGLPAPMKTHERIRSNQWRGIVA